MHTCDYGVREYHSCRQCAERDARNLHLLAADDSSPVACCYLMLLVLAPGLISVLASTCPMCFSILIVLVIGVCVVVIMYAVWRVLCCIWWIYNCIKYGVHVVVEMTMIVVRAAGRLAHRILGLVMQQVMAPIMSGVEVQ